MDIEGSYTFDAPKELVWKMLLDPIVLAKVMPNCQALEKTDDDEYEGKMKIQVGPVQGIFQGKVKLSNLQPPDSYHMQVLGKGPAGMVDGEGDVRLADADGKTTMHYTGQAKVSGRIASIGQRLMETSTRAIIKQSLENLEMQILASHHGQTEPSDVEPEPPSGLVENTTSKTTPVSSPPFSPETPSSKGVSTGSAISSPSPFQFATSIARELFDEFVPADRQKWVLAVLGLLLIHLYINWWANLIARRVVRRLG